MKPCEIAWEGLIKFHALRGKVSEEAQALIVQGTMESCRHIRRCENCKKQVKANICVGVRNIYPDKPDPEVLFYNMHKGLHRLLAIPFEETDHYGGTSVGAWF